MTTSMHIHPSSHFHSVLTLLCVLCAVIASVSVGGCARSTNEQDGRGHLLVIGGGLERDNAPVYRRFLELARSAAPDGVARVVIATAASGDESASEKSARAALAMYDAGAVIGCITRETPKGETVELLSRANAVFFTGGDQKRITTRYRPEPSAPPSAELAALRAVLERGGVIAGTSAGAAMMSEVMFLGGRSVDALGYARPGSNSPARGTPTDDPDNPANADEPPPGKGPNIGAGMGLIRTLITDSHFVERNRIGRLVAALEASNLRLGLGVAENACVHVDLASGEIVGISEAASQLIDIGAMHRQGQVRLNVRALTLRKETRVNINELLRTPAPPPQARAERSPPPIDITSTGERDRAERRVLALRVFERAANAPTDERFTLVLDGWQITTRRADGPGERGQTWLAFDLQPTADGR